MTAQQFEHCVGDRADPGLDRGSVRDAVGNERRDVAILAGHRRRRHLQQRAVSLGPTDHLAHMQRVLPECPRHLGVDFNEEARLADEPRGVVGIGAERDIAVRVGRRRGRQYERVRRVAFQQQWHLAEVGRHQVTASLRERRARHRRQEVRHVAEVVPIYAVQVRVIVQRVHLMHTNTRQLGRVSIQDVDQRFRLAVRKRYDDVRVRRDVGEHRFGRRGRGSRDHHPAVWQHRRVDWVVWAANEPPKCPYPGGSLSHECHAAHSNRRHLELHPNATPSRP